MKRSGMNHKEAIQAMLDGETLYSVLDEMRYIYFDTNFRNERGNVVDISNIDLSSHYKLRDRKGWRARQGKSFFFIDSDGVVERRTDAHCSYDTSLYKVGNYFKTKDEAEKALKALKKFWKEYRSE